MKLGLQINEGAPSFLVNRHRQERGAVRNRIRFQPDLSKLFTLMESLTGSLRNERIVVANLFFKYRH